MSLVKRPRMTERRLAALAENRKHSRGPATEEGRERIRAANLRHGFYSQSDQTALKALGEDPDDFRALLEGLCDRSTTADTLLAHLANRMARAIQRLNRADRMLEGYALRQASDQDQVREGRLHARMMQLKLTSRNWQLLAESVARAHYLTTAADLQMIQQLHREGAAREMSEVAVALFYQLREPGLPGPGDPDFQDAEEKLKTRRVMTKIRAIFGLDPLGEENEEPDTQFQRVASGPETPSDFDATEGADNFEPAATDVRNNEGGEGDGGRQVSDLRVPHYPESGSPHSITEEQWEAREPVRQLLENILKRQVEIFDGQHRDMMRECLSGPSPHERAAEIAPTHPHIPLMQRMEDSSFRQIMRISHLLLRMKREARLADLSEDTAVSKDVIANKAS